MFAHHIEVMNSIEKALQEVDVGYIRIDGSTAKPTRMPLIERFQREEDMSVALLSITACGTGLNLASANVALFAELNWSEGTMKQAEDRIHRIGQVSKSVRIIYLVARDTSDDIVLEQLQRKNSVLSSTVGSSANFMTISNAYVLL